MTSDFNNTNNTGTASTATPATASSYTMSMLGVFVQLILGASLLPGRYLPLSARTPKNLIIDTDLFSDVEYLSQLLFIPISTSQILTGLSATQGHCSWQQPPHT